MKNRRNLSHATHLIALLIFAWSCPLLPAAEPVSEAESLYASGQKYLRGDGVPRDEAKVFELMQAAAGKGHAEALATVGYCYSAGAGVAKDDAKARECFEKAAAIGSVSARGNLGLFLIRGRGGETDIARGLALMQAAADEGNLQSAAMLGEIFYFGIHADGQPDYQKAYAVLLKPAEAGNAAAQNMLGVILKDGRLGSKNEDAARVWFEKAALLGNGKACFNLAELWNYRSPDRWARIEALRWLIIGQGLDEVTARYLLEDIKANVAAGELSAAEKLAEITKANLPRRP